MSDDDDDNVVLPLCNGRYFSVVAFAYGKEDRDWLASLWRDAEGPWQLRYRFRYYAEGPGDPSDGRDRKNFWSVVIDRAADEENLVAKMRTLADGLVQAGFNDRLDWLVLRTSDVDEVIRRLSERDWFHTSHDAACGSVG